LIHNVDFYHSMINNFKEQDLKTCNYDYYQHSINLRCYLSELYDKINSEFDIAVDDIEPLYFINSKLSEVKRNLCNYRNNVINT